MTSSSASSIHLIQLYIIRVRIDQAPNIVTDIYTVCYLKVMVMMLSCTVQNGLQAHMELQTELLKLTERTTSES